MRVARGNGVTRVSPDCGKVRAKFHGQPMDVDYYFSPQSPWTYLGHQRFLDIARRSGARIRVLPVDLGGKVFPVSGGLPLAKRAPQRQAYRLVELKRFSKWLDAPLNLQPRYFPVSPDDAARLIDLLTEPLTLSELTVTGDTTLETLEVNGDVTANADIKVYDADGNLIHSLE